LTTGVTIPPVLAYSLLRVGLFAGTLLILLVLLRDLPFLLVVAIAALVSGLASYFLLSRQRRAMAGVVAARVQRAQQQMDAAAAAEDEALDAAEREQRANQDPTKKIVDSTVDDVADNSDDSAGQSR